MCYVGTQTVDFALEVAKNGEWRPLRCGLSLKFLDYLLLLVLFIACFRRSLK